MSIAQRRYTSIMLVETVRPFELEVDDLHPGAYRSAKNACWASQACEHEEEFTTLDLIHDIAKVATEIQQGFDLLMRSTGLSLPAHNAHVPACDYDLYPAMYRACKNTPFPEPGRAVSQGGEEGDEVEVFVRGVLNTVNSTLTQVLHRLSQKTAGVMHAIEKMATPEEDTDENDSTESAPQQNQPTTTPSDIDLYPGLSRAHSNRRYTGTWVEGEPGLETTPSLGEELVHGVKVAVQGLRRKWVHAHVENMARDQPDLHPDRFRYAVNHSKSDARAHALLYDPNALLHMEKGALADFFDTLSTLVASAA